MFCNSKKLKAFVLITGVLVVPGVFVYGQNTAPTLERTESITLLDSTRERDGLLGAVRRVKVQTAKLEINSGRSIEGPLQLLEITTYSLSGDRIENVSYPVISSTVGKEEYKYDDKGHIVEMTLRGDDGAILSREKYDYDFDTFGNWTKMLTSLVVFEGGELKFEPVEVTYRSLAYYFNDTIAQIVSSGSSTAGSTPAAVRGDAISSAVGAEVPANQLTLRGQPASSVEVGLKALPEAEPRETKETVLRPREDHDHGSSVEPASPAGSSSDDSSATLPRTAFSMRKEIQPEVGPVDRNMDIARDHLGEPKNLPANRSGENSNDGAAKVSAEPKNVSANRSGAKSNDGAAKVSAELKNLPANRSGANSNDGAAKVSAEPKNLPANRSGANSNDGAAKVSAEPKNVSANRSGANSNDGAAKVSAELKNVPANVPDPNETDSPPKVPAEVIKAFEYYRTGRQHFDSGAPKEAISYYQQSLKLEPNSAEVHLSLGHAYLKLKQDQQAIKSFKQATVLNSEMAEAFYGLGLSYFNLRRHREAAKAFKEATIVRPELAKAHYGLALAYQELEDEEGVLTEFRILERLDVVLAKKLADTFPEFNLPCRVPPYCK